MDEEVFWPEIGMYDAFTVDVLNCLDNLTAPSFANIQRNVVIFVEVPLKTTKACLGEEQALWIVFLPSEIPNDFVNGISRSTSMSEQT